MPLQTHPCNAFERHVFLLLVLNFVVAGLLFFRKGGGGGGGVGGSSQTLINENKVKQEDCDSDQ